jgi:hypothetical protein
MAGIAAVNVDVGSVLSGAGTLLKDIRAAITGKSVIDPNQQAEIELKILELENAFLTAQSAINMKEAENPNLFVSGWRPAAGWTCVVGFAYTFLGFPLMAWASLNFGWIEPPIIDAAILINLLFGMLGLAGMRTYEAKSGVKRTK